MAYHGDALGPLMSGSPEQYYTGLRMVSLLLLVVINTISYFRLYRYNSPLVKIALVIITLGGAHYPSGVALASLCLLVYAMTAHTIKDGTELTKHFITDEQS